MVSGCYSIITRSYANPNPSPPSLIANKSCCRNISYEEYCGKSIWLKPREQVISIDAKSISAIALTGMRLWQSIRLSIRPMNRESLYTLHPLQIYETAERHAGGTGGKTEDLGSLVTV